MLTFSRSTPLPTQPRIFALCGSTRSESSNLRLLQLIQRRLDGRADIDIFTDLASIPAFNPDEDANAPQSVVEFRTQIARHDCLLICSPEYAAGVPGALKNALDWIVGSGELYQKRCGIITAATLGAQAHASLIATVRIMGGDLRDECCLHIPGIQTKLGKDGTMHDEVTSTILDAFLRLLIRA